MPPAVLYARAQELDESVRDEDWEIDLAAEKHGDQRGFVVATCPLTNEEWDALVPGSLRVFKDGRCVYPL